MESEFELDLKLNFYDVMMMSAMIAHARRYGDNQLSDWAGDLRDRIKALGMPLPDAEMETPLKNVSPETAARVAVEATQVLEQLAETSTKKESVKPTVTAKGKSPLATKAAETVE